MSPEAPVAKRIPVERIFHGDTVVDEYTWLADKDNPDTVALLEAQNAYTEAMTAGQTGLRDEIFGEIKGRTKETDLSVPTRRRGWWYYSRTVEGQQYAVHCRRAVRGQDERPPMTEDGSPLDGEEILLDGNELAGARPYFALGAFSVSPDGTKLAYSTDYAGDERYTMRFKDLATGEVAADEIPGTYYGSAWSRDGSALFYVTVDDAWRPYRIWRHMLGTPVEQDVIVFEETDERFFAGVWLTRSERFVVISTSSKLTSEEWLLDASDPTAEPRVVAPRRQGVEYSIDHQAGPARADRLLILHNDGAENFEIATATLDDPAAWTPLVPHRPDTRLMDISAFRDHLIVYYRRDGLSGLRVLRADGSEYEVAFGEPVYAVTPGANPEYDSRLFRLGFVSLVTPDSVYDLDTVTGDLSLLRRRPVLELPGRGAYRPEDYEQHREWATAADGTKIPISIVRRKDARRDGSAPFLLYGYGSYEHSTDPSFSIPRLSLLDRGFGYAIAHIRGGGEMGRHWYDGGKLLNKINTFTDFVACARHLASGGWTSADAPGRARRLGWRAARRGCGQPGSRRVRGGRRAGPLRRCADHDPRSVAPAHRDRVGGVGRSAARPCRLRVHEVIQPLRKHRAGRRVPADPGDHEPERHEGPVHRAREMDRETAGDGKGRAVPAQDGDDRRAWRSQRPL